MPYVNVPNDLSKIKTKIAFNLTKRQLICFGAGAAIGVPTYLLTRQAIGNTGALFAMLTIMLPAFLLAMYEKDGLPFEKVIRNIIRPRCALGDRLAVAEVVVRHDQEAVRVQKARERLVAQRVLRHAVRDLQNTGRLPCGVPFDRVDGRPSVGGGKGKFFSILHSARLLCMV